MALDTSKAFDRFWHAGLLYRLLLSNRWSQVVLDGKYPINAGFGQGSILSPTPFLLYINDLSDYVICDTAIYADDTVLLFKFDQAYGQWQTLKLSFELEFDLQDTIDCDRKWLVGFNAQKTQLVSSDRIKNCGAMDVKMDGSVHEEKSTFMMLGLDSILDSCIVSIAKLPPRKLEP